MTEWWTYRPSDFLMFSPRIYWRLFESLNDAAWPWHVVLLGAPLAWLAAHLRARSAWTGHIAAPALFLAGCWALVAWVFLHQRFAPINWIADAYAVVFMATAALLVALACIGRLRVERRGARRACAVALALWALLGHPLLSALSGRPWMQAEVFGLSPDPTAIATLGFLLLVTDKPVTARWLRLLLWTICVLWCLLSAATLATMESPQAAVLVAAVVLALLAARFRTSAVQSDRLTEAR